MNERENSLKKKKESKKKILFVAEYLPDAKNSVADILQCILNSLDTEDNVFSFIHTKSDLSKRIKYDDKEFGRTYYGVSNKRHNCFDWLTKVLSRKDTCFKTLVKRLKKRKKIKNIKKIVRKERPDIAIVFVFTPEPLYSRLFEESGLPHIYILYDTYISRPGINKENVLLIESDLMRSSYGYYVPSFFFKEYSSCYNSDKLFSYNLPLLIEKESVRHAFENKRIRFDFLYLGQIQPFRNAERIKVLLRQLKIKLDIFSAYSIENDDTFQVHPAVSGDELYQVVADSRFLVVFDNSEPYAHYLPSKAYLYVSFTKPVIAFGDNEESALIDFFSNYPMFYYQNINKSLDGLVEFINSYHGNSFIETIYDKYVDYSPTKALRAFVERINEIL